MTESKYKIRIPELYHRDKKSCGYVYIIRVDNFVKIGSTKNKKRLDIYSSFPPFKFEVLLLEMVEDYLFYERSLQTMLLQYQVKGEWFEIPQQWKNQIKGARDIFKYVNKQIVRHIKGSKQHVNK